MNTINKINSCIILLGLAALPSGILPAQPKNIAPKPGMTIHGWVGSNNTGLPGVVVSDGFEVTTTDADGIYYLPSQKKHGYVFISIPGNYEAPLVNNIPQFFKHLKAGANEAERADFILAPADNDRHVVLVFGDTHLRKNLIDQFNICLADMNGLIDSYRAAGAKPCVLTVGDVSMERYWRRTTEPGPCDLRDYASLLKRLKAPVFNTMGNHDNDSWEQGDMAGERAWKDIIGPSYYSFNLGRAHYVALDNIVWANNGGSHGVNGDFSYEGAFTDYQMEWLVKDLATVADKTAPLIITMHIPLYGGPDINNNASMYLKPGHAQKLVDILKGFGFSNVLVLGGHTHANVRHTPPEYPWLTMKHIAALGGTAWEAPGLFPPCFIGQDGSPSGYQVYELDGKNVKWYYKSVGHDRNYQFRACDLNRVHITAEKYAPAANATFTAKTPEFAAPYHVKSDANEVLINVWGWEASWRIEVMEDGVPLPVTQISARDPLPIITVDFNMLNLNRNWIFRAHKTTHIFKVVATSPTSTLHIKVTDRFGNIYTETMTRPKELTLDMK